MRRIADGVAVIEGSQRYLGLEMGGRMTALKLEGGVLIHGPLAVPLDAVAELGSPRWVLAPNLMHHLYVGPWIAAGVESFCAPGLPEKRPDLSFDHVVEETGQPFGDEVLAIPLRCFQTTREVVLLHRPSRTLVVTDLVFNISPEAPWRTRAGMWCIGGYPGCKTTLWERLGMDRAVAREEIAALLELDFDRLILAHGDIIETGGRAALERAFSWLW